MHPLSIESERDNRRIRIREGDKVIIRASLVERIDIYTRLTDVDSVEVRAGIPIGR